MSSAEKDRTIAAVDTFKRLAEIPSVSSAEVNQCNEDGAHDVRLSLSARSYAALARTTQRCHLRLEKGRPVAYTCSPAVDTGDDSIKATFSSLPGSSQPRWTVILREDNGKAGKGKRRSVELWRGERCVQSADVTEHHGAFTTNDTYGSYSIHGDSVLYTAEANAPSKHADIRTRKPASAEDGLQDWEYRPPLGEKFGAQMQPTVFLLRFHPASGEEPELSRLAAAAEETDAVLSTALFGQAVFSTSGKDIYVTAYPTLLDGRRLGIVYCSNRPAVVYRASVGESRGGKVGDKEAVAERAWVPDKWTRLSLPGYSARSPRATAGQDGCFWLQSEEGGAHRDCDSLISQVGVEIPIQAAPDVSTGWPGLYVDQLRRSCLLEKVHGLATDSIWGSRKAIVLHRFGSNAAPTLLTPLDDALALDQTPEERGLPWSYTLLCTDGVDTLVVVRSSPLHPQQLLVGKLSGKGSSVDWVIARRFAEEWQDDKDLLSLQKLQATIEEVGDAKEGDLAVQSIVLRHARPSSPAPCILFPHGGPHGTTTTDWSPSNAALCLQGYTLVMPNYHGSLGRGQRFAHSLLGLCGRLDVEDCMACIRHLIKQGVAEEGNLFVQGGSHGGFLTLHLVGMHPAMFQRAIVRNPVVAAGVMEGTTDIPDWCYSEFKLPFPFESSPPPCPTTSEYETLQTHSPIHQLDAIQAPLLILLGLQDRRVPPAQSKLLYHRLRANKKPVRILAFEGEDHALDGVECELVAWEASLRWLTAEK